WLVSSAAHLGATSLSSSAIIMLSLCPQCCESIKNWVRVMLLFGTMPSVGCRKPTQASTYRYNRPDRSFMCRLMFGRRSRTLSSHRPHPLRRRRLDGGGLGAVAGGRCNLPVICSCTTPQLVRLGGKV